MTGRRWHPEHGQELAEYALLVPIFLLILMVITDLGRAVYYYSAIQNAAREGARYGIIHPDDPDGIVTTAENIAVSLNPADITVVPVQLDDETIQVSVTYRFTLLTPIIGALLGSNELILDSRATMQIEE